MRSVWLALIVLCGALWTGSAAEARSRSEQAQAQSRPASTQASRAAATRRAEAPQRQQSRAAQAPSRQAATRTGTSRQAAAARSGGRQQASNCRGRNCGSAGPRPVSWQSGLAPATNTQAQACPAGTLATLARGHTDIVRCMPL